jgi:hypothetical protein
VAPGIEGPETKPWRVMFPSTTPRLHHWASHDTKFDKEVIIM